MLYVTCMPVYNLAAILMVLEPRQQVTVQQIMSSAGVINKVLTGPKLT